MNRKQIATIAVFVILALLAIPIWWLIAVIIIVALSYIIITSQLKFVMKLGAIRWLTMTFSLFAVFVVAIAFRVFFIEIYAIPSGSMENTLLPGDKVLVNKLVYGPKLPNSPYQIPWVNLFWYLKADSVSNIDSTYWEHKRLSGFSKIDRGDVLVFGHPLWGKWDNYFIKRCIALPGDTLQICSGIITNNKEKFPEQGTVINNYDLWYVDYGKLHKEFSKIGDFPTIGINNHRDHGMLDLPLTYTQYESISKLNNVDSIKIKKIPDLQDNWVDPKQESYKWTITDYGPVVIPFRGLVIKINEKTFPLYSRTITYLEKVNIWRNGKEFFVDDKPIKEYTFKNDYYFMMGDNRFNSNDSRYWGFVSDANIVGKATRIIYSSNNDQFKWDRVFKKIK